MEQEYSERRREPRFPIVAGASVEVKGQGKQARATTVDISGCGVLLRFHDSIGVAVGDLVTCEFQLPQEGGEVLPYWGVGTIVRVKGDQAAVDLMAGGFSPLVVEEVVSKA